LANSHTRHCIIRGRASEGEMEVKRQSKPIETQHENLVDHMT
jgi:hypothetical protein